MKRIQKWSALLMAVTLLFTLAAPAALAAESTVTIKTAEDLAELSRNCTLDTWSQGKTVILENDLDLHSIDFTPIPTFSGTFQGNGHTISGLTLTGSGNVRGLFRYIQNGATVQDLTVMGTIHPNGHQDELGLLAGSNAGRILNCIASGTVMGDNRIGGLVGAGRSEVMRAIFGLDPISSGSVYLNGREVHIKNTRDAINYGIAMVNEDRRTYGLVLGRSIHHNVSLVNLKKYTKGLIDDRKISKDVEKMRELLQIKIANEDVEAGTLSGGNQQKVVLAKWLVGDVKVMILDEPTRGIDVGAKSEIHKLMTKFAREGMGIIMISSELPEVLGMSDRVVVMQEGIIQGTLDRSEATQESIMKLATRGVGKS